MYACLAVTCHLHFWQNDRDFLRATVVTRGWNGYRNKSQHRKSTLEKKILPPFQQGFEPATFQSRVRRSNHWAIPAPFFLRPQKRGGLLGTGTGGEGDKRVKARPWIQPERPPPPTPQKNPGETVDHRQDNESVKAVCPRHCAATSTLRNCCFNCRAWAESQRQCPLHCCWGTTRRERSPTFAAQLHLPAHDLFWANLKVQLHLPPLDLAWNLALVVIINLSPVYGALLVAALCDLHSAPKARTHTL